jgi:hypothetical protein
MIIDLCKTYRTRYGAKVQLVKIIGSQEFRYLGVYSHFRDGEIFWIPTMWNENGKNFSDAKNDLVEINYNYEDIPINTEVYALVKPNGGLENAYDEPVQEKRHFAGINSSGQPLVFNEGRTSWTSRDGDVTIALEISLLSEDLINNNCTA